MEALSFFGHIEPINNKTQWGTNRYRNDLVWLLAIPCIPSWADWVPRKSNKQQYRMALWWKGASKLKYAEILDWWKKSVCCCMHLGLIRLSWVHVRFVEVMIVHDQIQNMFHALKLTIMENRSINHITLLFLIYIFWVIKYSGNALSSE